MQGDSPAAGRAGPPPYYPDGDAQDFWQSVYDSQGQDRTGKVNSQLVEVASKLIPGEALDLGCGMGGDSIWLAQQGWRVLAVDVAESALRRAADQARQLQVEGSIEFQRHDLSDSFPVGSFDLVSAQYLHSPVRLHRSEILRRAATAVRQGGTMLIVDHGSAAPWSWKIPGHRFVSPQEVLDSLDLRGDEWHPLRVSSVKKQAIGPNGETATVTDNVVALRRNSN